MSTLPRRSLGATGISFSTLTFGSMRLMPERLSVREAVTLLAHLIDAGVDTMHVSSEYESFAYFAEVFRALRIERDVTTLRFIAKVGVPHFGEESFDPHRFRAKIDGYLDALSLERIDVVQWLLRYDLKQPEARAALFDRDADVVSRSVEALKRAGKIRSMVSFPYTDTIALRALDLPECDGLALYVNPLELDSVPLLDRAHAAGKNVLAIRPLAAGRMLTEAPSEALARAIEHEPTERVLAAFRYALAHPAVVTTVASLGSIPHADDAIRAVARCTVDHAWHAHVARS